MKRLLVMTVLLLLACGVAAKAQTQPRTCVIVKIHNKTSGDAWGRWTNAKPYDYVEGDYPSGVKFRSEISGKHIQEIRKRNGQVVIVNAEFGLPEMQDARAQCKAWTSQTAGNGGR